jgi:hypothetical protein
MGALFGVAVGARFAELEKQVRLLFEGAEAVLARVEHAERTLQAMTGVAVSVDHCGTLVRHRVKADVASLHLPRIAEDLEVLKEKVLGLETVQSAVHTPLVENLAPHVEPFGMPVEHRVETASGAEITSTFGNVGKALDDIRVVLAEHMEIRPEESVLGNLIGFVSTVKVERGLNRALYRSVQEVIQRADIRRCENTLRDGIEGPIVTCGLANSAEFHGLRHHYRELGLKTRREELEQEARDRSPDLADPDG